MRTIRTRNRDIAMIQEALKREGKIEGGDLVVPADFFTRLNAELNKKPPGYKSIIDKLVEDV
jgi:hypothetical protein